MFLRSRATKHQDGALPCFWLVGGVFFDRKLGYLHNEVHTTVDVNPVVEGQEVQGEFAMIRPGCVIGDNTPEGSGHSNGSELGGSMSSLCRQKRSMLVR